ncbi:FRG domain-containing protein [uncultured Limosilactobacillus sp.]|uniref:FRG domain-containing protein n=1 Tax=uncultured Limosilactobacillus sp. TaxID=2837629 RepID=UPI0025DCECE8|nr:FRG domain-containing protein [uncultured Limosilactobacillus sp.]
MSCEFITITSLSEFINRLDDLKIKAGARTLFYRGENKWYQTNMPGAIRNERLLRNEGNMFNQFIARRGDLFNNCSNNADRLLKMQHHQLPTRLLDVSENPLVALFFATENEDNDDGYVYIFTNTPTKFGIEVALASDGLQGLIKELEFAQDSTSSTFNLFDKGFYSDEVELEATMVKVKGTHGTQNDQMRFDNFMKSVENFCNDLSEFHLDGSDKKNPFVSNWLLRYEDGTLHAFLDSKKVLYSMYEDDFTPNKGNVHFSNDIFDELIKDGYHFSRINPIELYVPKIFRPKVIDDRLRNQQGNFIVVPFICKEQSQNFYEYTKIVQSRINMLAYYQNKKRLIIKIPKNNKNNIHHDLYEYGIKRSFVYPDDYSVVANEISNEYNTK